MNIFKFIASLSAAVIMSVTLVGCGGSVEDNIAEAERAVARGNYEVAQGICDDIMAGDEQAELGSTQLGRLSIIYLRLDERTDDGRNAEMATRCYRAAYEADADSARLFYSNLPTQDIALSETLRLLGPVSEEADESDGLPDSEYGGNDSAGDTQFMVD